MLGFGRFAQAFFQAGQPGSALFSVADAFGSLSAAEQQQFGADGWLARLQARAVR